MAVRYENYRFSFHARQRLADRGITPVDVHTVLLKGQRERRKDKFNKKEGSWNYSIVGKTHESRWLRVIVTFSSSGILIITVINLKGVK